MPGQYQKEDNGNSMGAPSKIEKNPGKPMNAPAANFKMGGPTKLPEQEFSPKGLPARELNPKGL